MSGVQKDDLDTATLEKLQRHNVNIDDLNNATKRQECTETETFSTKTITLASTTAKKFEMATKPNKMTTQTQIATTTTTNKLSEPFITGSKTEVVDLSKMETITKFWNVISTNLWKILPQNNEHSSTSKQPDNLDDLFKPKSDFTNLPFEDFNKLDNKENNQEVIFPYYPEARTLTDDLNIRNNAYIHLDDKLSKNQQRKPIDSKTNIHTTTMGVIYLARRKEQSFLKHNYENIMNNDVRNKIEPNILEIANQVKQLLLKDLKLEMTNNVALKTSTIATTSGSPTTNAVDQKFYVLEAKTVMDRFLHLCRHLKLETTTIKPKPARLKNDNLETEPVNPYYVSLMNVNSEKQIMPKPLMQKQIEFRPNNAFHPAKTRPIPAVYRNEAKTEVKYPNNLIEFKVLPKTIQTNSEVIPPLPIPINVKGKQSNFMKLIENQNIVITSKTPIQRIQNSERMRQEELSKLRLDNMNNILKNSKEKLNQDLRTDLKSRLHKPLATVHFLEETTTKSFMPLTKIHKHRNPKLENINRNADYEKSKLRSMESFDSYRPRYSYQTKPSIESIRGIIEENKQNIESMHNVIDSFERRKEDSGEDEPLVNQRPLAPIINKRVSKFDDTHFNDFMKTQRKVNNMLESILSSKSKRLLSIETV